MNDRHARHSLRVLTRGSIISLTGSILIGLINYLTRRTLVLRLEVSDYGYVYAVISLLSLILAFSDLGLGKALSIQAAPLYAQKKREELRRLFSVALITKLGIGLITSLVLMACYPWLETSFHYSHGYPIFLIFLGWFFVNNGLGVTSAFLEASQQFLLKNGLLCLRYLVILICIWLFIDALGPLAAALGFSVGVTIHFVALLIVFKVKERLRIHFKEYSYTRMFGMFDYAKWIALSIAGLSAMPHIDTLMLTCFHGTKVSGEYNVVLPIVQIIQSMFVFSAVFIPVASRLWNADKPEQLAKILKLTTGGLSLLFALGCILIYFQGERIISILFSQEYAYLAPIALLLCIGISLFLLGQIHLDTLNIAHQSKRSAHIMAIGLVTNVLCNFTLIPTYKLHGAAIATSISYLIIFILGSISTRRLFHVET